MVINSSHPQSDHITNVSHICNISTGTATTKESRKESIAAEGIVAIIHNGWWVVRRMLDSLWHSFSTETENRMLRRVWEQTVLFLSKHSTTTQWWKVIAIRQTTTIITSHQPQWRDTTGNGLNVTLAGQSLYIVIWTEVGNIGCRYCTSFVHSPSAISGPVVGSWHAINKRTALSGTDEVLVMRIRCIIGSFFSFTYKSKCRPFKSKGLLMFSPVQFCCAGHRHSNNNWDMHLLAMGFSRNCTSRFSYRGFPFLRGLSRQI